MKRHIEKIVKVCGLPEEFVSEYVLGASSAEEGIRRMKEYVKCVRKVEKEDLLSQK
ncbi:MAG: hypothetical protein WC648_01130 [Candidatus Paceibacterota bacterium]|jgi:hypothetical protein